MSTSKLRCLRVHHLHTSSNWQLRLGVCILNSNNNIWKVICLNSISVDLFAPMPFIRCNKKRPKAAYCPSAHYLFHTADTLCRMLRNCLFPEAETSSYNAQNIHATFRHQDLDWRIDLERYREVYVRQQLWKFWFPGGGTFSQWTWAHKTFSTWNAAAQRSDGLKRRSRITWLFFGEST